MTSNLKRVVRLDSIKLNATYFTDEGYLIDHPIVTTCGIFEYTNPDGTIRRELRLPEEVFSSASLASYKGKPIIITHDAGLVDKNTVTEEAIGTILSEGYMDGDNVRAEIVIHDTDTMKECGLRELSLGYNLTLDETPGEWNGEPYDAVQRNIEINHLALVGSARAGENARLNIDGKTEGGKPMFKKNRKRTDEDDNIVNAKPQTADESNADDDEMNTPPVDGAAADSDEPETLEDKVQMVKDRRDRRDAEDQPTDNEAALGVIAQQNEDIQTLLDCIDELQARKDFDDTENPDDKQNTDEDDDEANADDDESQSGSLNMDSVDSIVSQKLELCRIADKIHLDGIERMSITAAKKAIIKKAKPGVRLDGKSKAYIDAMYDITKEAINKKRNTDDQRRQMFNGDSRSKAPSGMTAANKARQAMINRQNGGNK